jgi:ketol-acid reductoisomerase
LIDENFNGSPRFNKIRQEEQDQLLEKVGAELRENMPFIDPVTIKPGE